jgi:ABC-type phosphate/phosphonate transport system substrate-binding protein
MMEVHEPPKQPLIANARMYSVSAAAAAAWRQLLEWVLLQARLPWSVIDHPAPKPLLDLWERDDLGCTLMCGLAHALHFERATPIVAPVVRGARYRGLPIYFTDIAVRKSSPFRALEDTFGARVGYTISGSHSGYVALREHLLPYRQSCGAPLFREVVGPLVSPRGVVDALLADRIDVGPVDSYALGLMRQLEPELAGQLRVVAVTAPAPIPLFVATAPLDERSVRCLRDAFVKAAREPRLQSVLDRLLLDGFAIPSAGDYATFRARSAVSDRYPEAW